MIIYYKICYLKFGNKCYVPAVVSVRFGRCDQMVENLLYLKLLSLYLYDNVLNLTLVTVVRVSHICPMIRC